LCVLIPPFSNLFADWYPIDFSVALNRGSAQHSLPYEPNLGYLALGGIVPSVPTVAPSVTVPIQGYKMQDGSAPFFYYTVSIL
jgi:hypothetical protein